MTFLNILVGAVVCGFVTSLAAFAALVIYEEGRPYLQLPTQEEREMIRKHVDKSALKVGVVAVVVYAIFKWMG